MLDADFLQIKCDLKHPPGDEIYKTAGPIIDGATEDLALEEPPTISGNGGKVQNLSMFEVDGKKSKMYCQVHFCNPSLCSLYVDLVCFMKEKYFFVGFFVVTV